MEKVHFHGIMPNYRGYLYAKPRGISSSYSEGEVWWISMKLQVPVKWLHYSHGNKVQRHRVVQLLHTWGRYGKLPSSPWDSSVTDSPKINLQMATRYWTVKSELALMDTRHKRPILAWDSTQAISLTFLRGKANLHRKRAEL